MHLHPIIYQNYDMLNLASKKHKDLGQILLQLNFKQLTKSYVYFHFATTISRSSIYMVIRINILSSLERSTMNDTQGFPQK